MWLPYLRLAGAVRRTNTAVCHEGDDQLLIPLPPCSPQNDAILILTSHLSGWSLRQLDHEAHYPPKGGRRVKGCRVLPGITWEATVWEGDLRSSHTQTLLEVEIACASGDELALLLECRGGGGGLHSECQMIEPKHLLRGNPFLATFDQAERLRDRIQSRHFLWVQPERTLFHLDTHSWAIRHLELMNENQIAAVWVEGEYPLLREGGLIRGLLSPLVSRITVWHAPGTMVRPPRVSIAWQDSLLAALLANKTTVWRLWQTAQVAMEQSHPLAWLLLFTLQAWWLRPRSLFEYLGLLLSYLWMLLCLLPLKTFKTGKRRYLSLFLALLTLLHPIPLWYDLLCIQSGVWLLHPASLLRTFSWLRQIWWAWREGPPGSSLVYLRWLLIGIPQAPRTMPWLQILCLVLSNYTELALLPLPFI